MLAFVELFAIITTLFIPDVSPVPSASTSPLWRRTYTQSSHWYSDYAIPKPEPKKDYLPTPQNCPETGRTVCSQVKPFYPTDEVFEVIRSAKAKRFNISSEFIDESQNDEEPNLYDQQPLYEQQPLYDNRPNGYVVYQKAFQYDYKNRYNRQQTPNYHSSYSPHNSPPGPHYGSNDNTYGNRGQIGSNQRPNEPYLPYQYSKEKSSNYYPQQQSTQGFQSFPNEMISQQRYKRQTAAQIETACPSRMILVEPKAALNDKSQWKFVINLADRDPRLKQAIKVEVCQTPGQSCSNQVSLPFGFVSRCKQKYIKKKLLSLDSSGQSISSENFFAPSCCVCEIVRNTNKRK